MKTVIKNSTKNEIACGGFRFLPGDNILRKEECLIVIRSCGKLVDGLKVVEPKKAPKDSK